MAYKAIITDGTKTETILYTKGINPFNDERPGVWSPDSTGTREGALSNRLVPSMFAGIGARMQAMSDLPFTIYALKGDKEIDNSDNYKNAIGFLPNPYRFLSLTEGSLVLSGAAYWYKGKGEKTGKTKQLRYWIPQSVTLDADAATQTPSVIQFKRQGMPQPFPENDILYMWGIDPEVELGAPLVYPFASALVAAQANGAINQWVADYMKRGAIKAMMLMVDGMPPPTEVERMESWFNRFMSGAKSLTWKVFNSAGVKPTVIGEGLDALRGLTITQDLRYEIHTALGTRHLLQDENYATAEIRDRQFYTNTIVPDARLIQSALNEQELHKAGYHIEFEPERLEAFQVNEAEQAASFGVLFSILKEGLPFDVAFKLASEKLDYKFTDEQFAVISTGVQQKQDTIAPVIPIDNTPPDVVKALVELDKWEAKVKAAGKMCVWHPVSLSADIVKRIRFADITFDDARAELKSAPEDDAIKALAAAIEKAVLSA